MILNGGPHHGEEHRAIPDDEVLEVPTVRDGYLNKHPSQVKIDVAVYASDGEYLGLIPEEWLTWEGYAWEPGDEVDGDGVGGYEHRWAPEVVFAMIVAGVAAAAIVVFVWRWFADVA